MAATAVTYGLSYLIHSHCPDQAMAWATLIGSYDHHNASMGALGAEGISSCRDIDRVHDGRRMDRASHPTALRILAFSLTGLFYDFELF